MLCSEKCPRNFTNCKPLSNVISDEDNPTFVCVGLNDGTNRTVEQDIFRHCFKSETTDTMFDLDKYDLKSNIAVMADALLIDEIEN